MEDLRRLGRYINVSGVSKAAEVNTWSDSSVFGFYLILQKRRLIPFLLGII
jgi:hypothetical protein